MGAEIAVLGRIAELDFRLNRRRELLGEGSSDELESVEVRILLLDLRLKIRCGMLGEVSWDNGEEGEGGRSEGEGLRLGLDFRLKSCIFTADMWLIVAR